MTETRKRRILCVHWDYCKQGPCCPEKCFNENFKCIWYAFALGAAESKEKAKLKQDESKRFEKGDAAT